MIRAVAFDLWETLITDTADIARQQESLRLDRMAAVLDGHALARDREKIVEAYRQLWHQCHERYWQHDLDVATRQHITHFLEALEMPAAELPDHLLDELEEAYAAPARIIPPLAVPGAFEAIEFVRSCNLKTGLISNTGRTPGTVLREVLSFHRLTIDAMVFSNEHGQCKPRRSIFEKLCAALELSPEDIVFVGDNLYADVAGAQQCGMTAIHFDPPSRGLAVAPPSALPVNLIPHRTIRSMRELPAALQALGIREAQSAS